MSCKREPDGWWGLYLLDVFDNLVSIRVEPGAALSPTFQSAGQAEMRW